MRIVPLDQHPEGFEQAQRLLDQGWPSWFHGARRVSGGRGLADAMRSWPGLQLLARDEEGPVALANAVPLAWDGPLEALPQEGWDWALDSAAPGPTLCALAVTVRPDRRGQGLSGRMLSALSEHRRALGYRRLIVPVRPNGRPLGTPLQDWVERTRADGLPADPWLRTHVRLGGRPLHLCQRSMRLSAEAGAWESWLARPLRDGPNELESLLVPLQVRDGVGHYTEPNVWVLHP